MKEMAAAHAGKNESASLQRHPGSVSRARRETKAENGSLKGLAKPLICRGCRSSLGDLQPKLVVGPADDEYEREADRVADQAVSMPEPRVQRACPSCDENEAVQTSPLATQITPLVQRQAKPEEEEEEKIQTKPLAGQISPLVQRQVEPEDEEEKKVQAKRPDDLVQRQEEREEEEEKLQAKSLVQRVGPEGGDAVPQLEQSLVQARGNGRPLAEGFRGRMESAFGADFSSVRIHSDEQSDRLSRSIQARAFTRGHDIFLRQGEYQPASAGGQRLLAHELTHVVQQNSGAVQRAQMQAMERVNPTKQLRSKGPINDDAHLEQEADYMGQLATKQGNTVQQKVRNQPLFQHSKVILHGTIQRLAVNLQNDDEVVKKLVTYAQQKLGMNDQVVDSMAIGAKTLGTNENIYLFGHGGSSRIDMEHNDLFARIDMQNLAQLMHQHLVFPKDYAGTIYLIGCHTSSLINALKGQLDELTGRNLDIRGTYEKLQTTDDDVIVHRDPSESTKEENMRAHADLLRSYYHKLIQLRSMRLAGRKALLDAASASNKEKVGDALLAVNGQNTYIKTELQKIEQAIGLLKDAIAPKLKGRLSGFNSVYEVFNNATKTQTAIKNNLLLYLDRHEANKAKKEAERENLDEFDVGLALSTAELMKKEYKSLNEEVQVTAILIETYDSPDVMHSKPFDLGQMVGPLKPQGGVNWGHALVVGGIAALFFSVNYLLRRL